MSLVDDPVGLKFRRALANQDEALLELDRIDCEESLSLFLQGGWKFIDPAPCVWGWHLDAIAEHLEAVIAGQIPRLLINVPPRSSKSSLISIALPAYIWAQRKIGPLSGPQVQILCASYGQSLSNTLSTKCRRLIQSSWYQERWSKRFQLSGDQNAKQRYDTDKNGYRIATSVDGTLTGEGGDVIIVDDAVSAKEALSEAHRVGANEWWDTSMSTRLNNMRTGAFIVVAQRLHEDDLPGHILNKDQGEWVHLNLPMRYESDRHCVTVLAVDENGTPTKTWEDPRLLEGELLAPSRFNDREVNLLESELGPFNAAGQLQQRPEPKGGGIFKFEWWKPFGNPDNEKDPMYMKYPKFDYIVASLDTAYTEKQENDYSALTVWGVWSGRSMPITPTMVDQAGNRVSNEPRWREAIDATKVMLIYAWQERLALHELVTKAAESCRQFKVDRLLVEAKASGLSVAQEIRRLYINDTWGVQLINPGSLDKVARAYSVQHLFSEGMVWAPFIGREPRKWADMLMRQMASFPRAAHDDLTDSATMALRHLRDIGFAVRVAEINEAVEESLEWRSGNSKPLYPGSR